jgi:phosphoribosylamine--glycine ligase
VKICIASLYAEGAFFAYLLSQEGHDVSMVVKEERYAEALKGLVTVMPGSEVYAAEKYDMVVMDSTGMGETADEAREQVPTLGGSELADRLEEDRLYALDFMVRCGLTVSPYESFDNPSDGIRHIKKRNKRLVFKPFGEQSDKATTYVAKSPEDMLRYFDVLFRSAKVKEYILQDFVEGIEASTEVYVNSTGYYALNGTLELKKFMNGNLGPNTGCAASLVWMYKKETPLFQKGLKKCIEPLQEMGYVGPIDLNTISNAEGTWALEFTPRIGYDSEALLSRLLPIGLGDFFYAIANEEVPPDLTAKHPFCASVRVSIPPYPAEMLPDKFYKAGVPIEGLTGKDLDRWFIYDIRKRGESDELESAGLCGWLGSPLSVGDTLGAAFDGAYESIKSICVPDIQYRTDACDCIAKRYWALRENGLLKGS